MEFVQKWRLSKIVFLTVSPFIVSLVHKIFKNRSKSVWFYEIKLHKGNSHPQSYMPDKIPNSSTKDVNRGFHGLLSGTNNRLNSLWKTSENLWVTITIHMIYNWIQIALPSSENPWLLCRLYSFTSITAYHYHTIHSLTST